VTELSYVTVVWSMIATGALLLGLMHLARWSMDRSARVDLTFSIVALAFVGVAIAELGTMHAHTPGAWGQWVKWCHVPLAVMIIGTIVFVRQYLGSGRTWLAYLLIGLRLLILAINLVVDPNVNFERIDSIAQVEFLGETVSVVGEAVTGRWQFLGTAASLLLSVFVLDAAVTHWGRGGRDERRQAVVIGGGVFFFVTLAAFYVQLVIWGVASLPLLITPCFAPTLLAMAYELSRDTLRAGRLARDLDESRRRLELAAEAADVGLCEWDSGSGRIWATARAREIFGLSDREGGVPGNWLGRVHPDDAGRLLSELQAALAQGQELNLECRVCPPGRGTRWVAAHGRAEHPRGGTRTRLRGFVRDVSEQRRTLHESQELRRELAHVGRVSMLGQLASSLAHELSQPLGAILRNTEAAEMLLDAERPDVEELKAIVADIHRDDRRAGEVIDRLRALLKRRQMVSQPLHLDALVNDVQAVIRADAASRHVTIDWQVETGLPPIAGDRVHLSQVLINLIINAMDAVMERAPADRRVAVQARRGDGQAVELCVSDTGHGIPPELLSRIFEPFYTTKESGMGMGLSICRTIVNAHRGALMAENRPEGGATFRISLDAVAGSVA
jgi:two-component system sensor kinase FixL